MTIFAWQLDVPPKVPAVASSKDIPRRLAARPISRMFEHLYQPKGEAASAPPRSVARAIVDQFNRYFYSSPEVIWKNTRWRGVPVSKAPTDLWVYQEILFEVRPNWIIETGTWHGGSAYYLADICELLGTGRVISVDVAAQPDLPEHPRVKYLSGSSVDPEVVDQVKRFVDGGVVMVVLDSDHSFAHVRAEMAAYSPLVTPCSYLIVEDTICNGNPALPGYGPGPMEAVADFLKTTDEFSVDHDKERFLLTFNRRGYLRRESLLANSEATANAGRIDSAPARSGSRL